MAEGVRPGPGNLELAYAPASNVGDLGSQASDDGVCFSLFLDAAGIADAQEVASKLITHCGNLARAIALSRERLIALVGPDTAGVVTSARQLMLHILRSRLDERPLLADWQALLDYLMVDMAPHVVERVRILHLDLRNRLIEDELLWSGTIDQSPIFVREIIHRALDLGAASLIIAHNHPSGDPAPSRADIDVTREIVAAGRALGIAVHDHLIIGAQGYVSLRAKGLI